MTEDDVGFWKKILIAAGRGGYLVDWFGNLCFDGDKVRFDYHGQEKEAALQYDKDVRRWYFYTLEDGEFTPCDDTPFTLVKGVTE